MLIGQYKHTIDNKKRLSLPAKFRGELGSKVVVTKGFEGCLIVYTEKERQIISEKMSSLTSTQSEARAVARNFLSGASEADVDKLGRILVPDYLKEYADLKKEVVVCGLSTRLEIWDSEKWKKYMKQTEQSVDEMVSKLGEFGI